MQFNQQRLQGDQIDYLTPFKETRQQNSNPHRHVEINWSEYVKKSMVKQVKATKQQAILSHLSTMTGPI